MLLTSVRQFKRADFPRFAEFIKKQFHEKYILSDEAFFEWQYRSNPYLDDYALFLLEQDNKLYGYIGMVPLDYKMGERSVRLKVYANLFVDERVRSLGLGTLLIKRAMEQGSPAMISGYTPQSFSSYQKLGGWRALGNFYRYVYLFNHDAVTKLLPDEAQRHNIQSEGSGAVIEGSSGLTFEPVDSFDASFDEFWRSVRARYGITVERTSAYLNWRYANHPQLNYEMWVAKKDGRIMGYLVYRIESVGDFSIARIIDFVSREQGESDILRKFVSEVRTRVDMVDFMFSGQYYHETLNQLGFFNVYGTPFEQLPMYFNPITYSKDYINFCAWQESAAIDENVFYDRNKWYLTRGDSDQDRPNPH